MKASKKSSQSTCQLLTITSIALGSILGFAIGSISIGLAMGFAVTFLGGIVYNRVTMIAS